MKHDHSEWLAYDITRAISEITNYINQLEKSIYKLMNLPRYMTLYTHRKQPKEAETMNQA